MLKQITVMAGLLSSFAINSKTKTNEGHLLITPSKKQIKQLRNNPEISFDHKTRTTIEVYGPEGLK